MRFMQHANTCRDASGSFLSTLLALLVFALSLAFLAFAFALAVFVLALAFVLSRQIGKQPVQRLFEPTGPGLSCRLCLDSVLETSKNPGNGQCRMQQGSSNSRALDLCSTNVVEGFCLLFLR